MIADTRSTALRDTRFGAGLPEDVLARLETLVRPASYPAGAEILREGDPTSDLGVVVGGRVALRLRVPERGPTTILTVEEGDVIGWSVLVPPHRATSSVVALVPTELLVIDGPGLRAALDADPVLAAAVYRSLFEAIANRLTGTRAQFLDLFARPLDEPW